MNNYKKKNPLKLCKASTDSKDINNITTFIISFLTQKIKIKEKQNAKKKESDKIKV